MNDPEVGEGGMGWRHPLHRVVAVQEDGFPGLVRQLDVVREEIKDLAPLHQRTVEDDQIAGAGAFLQPALDDVEGGMIAVDIESRAGVQQDRAKNDPESQKPGDGEAGFHADQTQGLTRQQGENRKQRHHVTQAATRDHLDDFVGGDHEQKGCAGQESQQPDGIDAPAFPMSAPGSSKQAGDQKQEQNSPCRVGHTEREVAHEVEKRVRQPDGIKRSPGQFFIGGEQAQTIQKSGSLRQGQDKRRRQRRNHLPPALAGRREEQVEQQQGRQNQGSEILPVQQANATRKKDDQGGGAGPAPGDHQSPVTPEDHCGHKRDQGEGAGDQHVAEKKQGCARQERCEQPRPRRQQVIACAIKPRNRQQTGKEGQGANRGLAPANEPAPGEQQQGPAPRLCRVIFLTVPPGFLKRGWRRSVDARREHGSRLIAIEGQGIQMHGGKQGSQQQWTDGPPPEGYAGRWSARVQGQMSFLSESGIIVTRVVYGDGFNKVIRRGNAAGRACR